MILRHEFLPLDNNRLSHLCGSVDEHLRDIETVLGVSISRRNEFFRIEGAKVSAERAMALLQALYDRADATDLDEAFQLALVEALAEAMRARAALAKARRPPTDDDAGAAHPARRPGRPHRQPARCT